jgi:predicted dehydrogenase
MGSKIRVGIIGANPNRGWALAAHVPALRSLPAYEIRAVSTTRDDSAKESARRLGAPLAFSDYHGLLAEPEIDLVVIAVNVTQHVDVAKAAIEAGKNVLCEWPLGRNVEEAEMLAKLARDRHVRTFIGLQGRAAPPVRHARDLVAKGAIGKLLGTRIVGTCADDLWRGRLAPEYELFADPKSGNSMLAIPVGHAMDMLAFVVGEFATLSSTLIARRGEGVRLRDQTTIALPMHDQIAFSGVLEGGALASVHYRGGASTGPDFVWEINGTDGDLLLTAERGYANISALTIRGSRGGDVAAPLEVPDADSEPMTALSMPAVNVAALYAQVARDLTDGTAHAPDFDVALRRHRLLDAVERASATGLRQTLSTTRAT